ncbi:prepilin peptidase [Candidatus Dependentiae bacterium]|nr:MAG: prepilin peptidase [Candidatus Dependentiae bacterium]
MIVSYAILSLVLLTGICWGSFLNVIGYRLMHQDSIFFPKRSYCPSCKQTLHFVDLIPVFSWIILNGHCRYCKAPISYLYPFIEILTGIATVILYTHMHTIFHFIFGFIFCSSLFVITRTDLETMLISQWTTVFLVPIALVATLVFPLPVVFFESAIGAFSAYVFLYAISWCYKKYKKCAGIGEGDIEMLCMIGAFLGPVGWWLTLVLSSFLGSIAALYMFLHAPTNIQNIKIPFGPFLALGAFITLIWQQWVLSLFIPF